MMAKEDTRTSPSYKITCALPFTEQDEVTFQHGKIWELSTKKCAQSTADKRRVRLMSSLPHKNEVSAWTTHCALCKAKAFSAPEKPPLAMAWIVSGGRFFLPFISEKLHWRLLLQLFPWVSLKYLRLKMLPRFGIKIAAKLSSAHRKAAA